MYECALLVSYSCVRRPGRPCRVSVSCRSSIAGLHSVSCQPGLTLASPPSASRTSPPSTAQILSNALSPYQKFLKCAHINSQSLPGHISEIREIFRPQNFDIIGISESWLKPSIRTREVALPGYVLLRNDRTQKIGGGVAAYVREGLRCRLLSASPSEYSARPEFMFIEIGLSGSDVLLLGVCYRPPKTGHLTDFENTLLHHMPSYSRVLIMGDFNTDLLTKKREYDYRQLTTMFDSCDLTILPFDATHHTATSDTLLDLMVVTDPSDVVNHGQLPIPAVSKHDLIYCVIKVRLPKPKIEHVKYRDFKNMDELSFMSDVYTTPWHIIETLPSIDDMVNAFNTIILDLYNKYAPVVTKRITKRRPVPWMTNGILSLMAQRDSLYRKAKRTSDPNLMVQYRHLRNRVKQLLRNSRLSYTRNLFEKKQSSNDLWRKIKRLGLGKDRASTTVQLPLNDLNNFFVSCSQTVNANQVTNYAYELLNSSKNRQGFVEFDFKPVIQYDVLKAIRRIGSNAIGSDGIQIRLIKNILFATLPVITFIFNTSLKQGIFPSQWKSAIIRPLTKTSIPTTCQDFRPISILPALSKGLERIVHCQITDFLTCNHILNNYQSGFRKGHSTETALLKVTEDIRLAMDKGQGTILTLFDFSKAFDCVNHALLLAKLRAIGFSVEALKWLRSYLSDRRQCVQVDGMTSDWLSVKCGVPQGSILGPLLFVLYVNDINMVLTHCKSHMYADDLQIYLHFNVTDLNDCVDRVNDDIKNILKWTDKHGLKLNHEKTKPIVICHYQARTSLDFATVRHVTVNGFPLPYYDKVKNLGLTMNCTLNWNDAITDICKKVFSSIHTLKKLQRFLPIHIKLLLFKVLIMPHFAYCNSVINDMTVALGNKIQKSQNYCLRYVFDLKWDEHITPYYINSKILKLNDLRSIKILTLTHSILKSGFPNYFSNTFQFVSQQGARSTRSGSFLLRMPQHRSAGYDKSFVVMACRLWNSLPRSITSLESRPRFVAALKAYYLRRMIEAGSA